MFVYRQKIAIELVVLLCHGRTLVDVIGCHTTTIQKEMVCGHQFINGRYIQWTSMKNSGKWKQ